MPRWRSATSSRPSQARAAPGLVICIQTIELAFKRLKTLLGLGRLPAKGEALARSWLLAHLIVALLIEDTSRPLLDCLPPPAAPRRCTSLWRVTQTVRDALLVVIRGVLSVAALLAAAAILAGVCPPAEAPPRRALWGRPSRSASAPPGRAAGGRARGRAAAPSRR